MKTIVLILLLTNYLTANAQQFLTAEQVGELFYSSHCNESRDGQCQNEVSFQNYKAGAIRLLPENMQQILFKRAFEQAQIWGDTILEGDYAADGKTQLNIVTLIRHRDQIVGFAVTYSEVAWFTGDCRYSSEHPESLSNCEKGRIYETSFVSTDMKDAIVDENQFASFSSED